VSKALTFIELDIEYCSLSYGVSPCTATLSGGSPTGTIKCFNSKGTCQDRVNFATSTVTLRFAEGTAYLAESGIEAIACIEDIAFTPGTISLGEDLGTRSSLKVTMADFPWSDTGPGFDKYLADRTYDPYRQGTFWGKFRSRHPSLRGRAIRVIRGFLGQTLEEMETRHYVVESIDGPARDGKYAIISKDVLKLLDGDRAQAPKMSNGFLAGDINDSTTSATLSPSGIGNLEYPSSGYVAIGGSEICAFTRSGNALTLTRGQFNTTAVAHSASDRVQICIRYTSADIADVLNDLMVNYAAMPGSYIDLVGWKAETTTFLRTLYTALIAEPTSVEKLTKELIRQGALSLWWDDIARLIRLKVLRQIDTDAAVFDENVIVADSLAISDQPTKRLSQVWTYFAQINPLKGVDDTDNYRSCSVVANLELESDYGSPAIEKIYSRWIPLGGRAIAERIGEILVGRFGRPPRRFKLTASRGGPVTPTAGIGYKMSWRTLQDATGERIEVPAQVVRIDAQSALIPTELEEFDFSFVDDGDPTVIFDIDTYNVNARTVFDLFYPTPESGDDVYFIVEAGVKIGSTSTSQPAFNVGSWPSGVNVHLIVRGRIQGKGGKGGAGTGQNGFVGGPALYTRRAITIEKLESGDPEGEIFGGGGGGGGGYGLAVGKDAGGGGGGGAGFDPGQGASDGAYGGYSDPGTTEAGGNGSDGVGSSNGGNGGGPGLSGQNGSKQGLGSPGTGGAAGAAIDGVSYVTLTGASPDRRGPQIN